MGACQEERLRNLLHTICDSRHLSSKTNALLSRPSCYHSSREAHRFSACDLSALYGMALKPFPHREKSI